VTTTEYRKPLPRIHDPRSRPYWEAAKRHELRMQRCPKCGYVRFPPGRYCPECLEASDTWITLSGRGTVWSFGIYDHVFNQAFNDDIPYNVALVELEEGPRLITNIVGIPNEAIAIGMPVEVAFDDVTDEVTLVKFRPRSASA